MKLVVGLGNPGPEYHGSPHNLGFAVVDRLAARNRVELSQRKAHSRCARYILKGEPVWLIQPQTFMNRSGTAVKQWLQSEVVSPDDLVVIVDELDLPWGQIRIRRQGSSGGHHGLDSMIEATGTRRFTRVRIGVGANVGANAVADAGSSVRADVGAGVGADARRRDPVEYLLQPVAASRRRAYEDAVEEAAQATEMILREGVVKAMTRFNRRPQPETQPEPESPSGPGPEEEK